MILFLLSLVLSINASVFEIHSFTPEQRNGKNLCPKVNDNCINKLVEGGLSLALSKCKDPLDYNSCISESLIASCGEKDEIPSTCIIYISKLIQAAEEQQQKDKITKAKYEKCNDVYCRLKVYLDHVNFSELVLGVNPSVNKKGTYNIDNKKVQLAVENINFLPKEYNILSVFYTNRIVNWSENIFPDMFKNLRKELLASELVVNCGAKGYQMRYSITPLVMSSLPEPIYILHAPFVTQACAMPIKKEVEINDSSITTLEYLNNYIYKNKEQLTKIKTIADFGSGTGILAIILLKMFPNIENAAGLEILDDALKSSTLTARINGLDKRFTAINNTDTENLNRWLHSKSATLDFAVMNPPWNIVSKCIGKSNIDFSVFGDGGPDGLDVIKIFMGQITELKNNSMLSSDFFIFLFSLLAKNNSNQFLIESVAQDFTFEYQKTDNATGWDCTRVEEYVNNIVSLIRSFDIHMTSQTTKIKSLDVLTFENCVTVEWKKLDISSLESVSAIIRKKN